MILELKIDSTADEAIDQIKNKQYAMRFAGKLGEKTPVGNVLAIGISYDGKSKVHHCKVQEIV